MDKKYFEEFINIVSLFESKEDLKSFFIAILTPKELQEIPKRLQIVKMLKKGIAQREIAQELKVGVATVTRGSRELQKGNFKNIK